jgi:hypothetical protein
MRKMREFQSGQAGLLLRHFIRRENRKLRLLEIVSFLRQLFRQPLQHLSLALKRSLRLTVYG